MIAADTLPVFAALALVTIATPGPTMLLALNHGARHGVRAAGAGIAGALVSDGVLITASAVGLGTLLVQSDGLFMLVQWLGVVYLGVLGIQLLLPGDGLAAEQVRGPGTATRRQLFWHSFAVAVTNPKGYVFFAALLAPFIRPGEPLLPQYATLAAVFVSLDAAILLLYASAGHHAGRLLPGQRIRWLPQASGVCMLVLAGFLALYRHDA